MGILHHFGREGRQPMEYDKYLIYQLIANSRAIWGVSLIREEGKLMLEFFSQQMLTTVELLFSSNKSMFNTHNIQKIRTKLATPVVPAYNINALEAFWWKKIDQMSN
ncbi:unnamed protein product [Nezara viridula]|uniref:Uncharacterized protein n=1 Tax=Nezara viridula TaxID=85310 RepID=A0A9P0H784_NEZVI|nr:unnamed protein product [Nezara viridula]